jgi:hypothetical protein
MCNNKIRKLTPSAFFWPNKYKPGKQMRITNMKFNLSEFSTRRLTQTEALLIIHYCHKGRVRNP